MANDWWMIWPGNPALSAIVLFFLLMPFLWAGRRSMHGVIIALTYALSSPLRTGARWLMRGARELSNRNRTVLLAHGRAEVVQSVEREFDRMSKKIERDLHDYPSMQRKVMEEITNIEEDYKNCTEVPPPPPEWTDAIKNIAKIKKGTDGIVEKLLADISKSIDKGYNKVIAEYRKAYESRHKSLKSFQPSWRSLDNEMKEVNKKVTGLQESAQSVDVHMEKFEGIIAKTKEAEHALTSSATIQLTIATLVLIVAFGGAYINSKLISLPLSEMVGAGDYITANLQTSDVAALVIIFIEATMGLFFLESLRITHLFPRINNMEDGMRRILMWVSLTILLILAGIEVALAVMRDQIVAASMGLKQSLAGTEDIAAVAAAAAAKAGLVAKIPLIGQMVLGFILPIALAFVGIPLEYFIYSARTVLGTLLVLAIRALAVVFRFAGNLVRHLGGAITHIYDVLIFLPLLIERAVKRKMGIDDSKHAAEVASFNTTLTNFRNRHASTGGH
jgi:hypothetical protein